MAAVNSDVVAFGSIQQGRLVIRNRRDFDAQLRQMKDGAEVEIEVCRKRATRSLHQNAWYWSVIVEMLSRKTGYTPDEMHHLLKAKFIPKRLAVCDGNGVIVEEYVLGGSTRKMTTIQFSEYCESIREWAAGEPLTVVIPDPETFGEGDIETSHGWGV